MAKIETSKAGHECSGSLRVKAEPTPPPPPARAKTRPFSSAHVERTCFTNPFSRLFAGCCILHITLLVPFVCPVISSMEHRRPGLRCARRFQRTRTPASQARRECSRNLTSLKLGTPLARISFKFFVGQNGDSFVLVIATPVLLTLNRFDAVE